MKRNIFIIVWLFIFLQSPFLLQSQQTYFSKIYNPFNTAAIGRHILVTDSGYLAGGVGKSGTTNIQTLVLLKIDNNGNLQSISKPVTDSIKYAPGVAGSMIKTNDGGYAWAAQARTPIKDFGLLLKLDSSLNKQWEKEYLYNNDTVYSYLGTLQSKQTSDNGFILVGDVDGSGQYNTDILLIKTDSFGNEKWQKTYNYIGLDRGWNIIQTPDKGFLIGGGGYIAGVDHSYDGLIIKTDSLGNEQWRKFIESIYDDYFCVVANSPDGNYIVGTTTGVGIITPDDSDRRIRLVKINPGGSVIWDKMYSEKKWDNVLNSLLVLSNGDIVSVGSYYPANSQQTDSWGWILKTNTNGDSLWMREHFVFNGHANANKLYDLKQTKDNGFIACGQVDSMPAVPQSIWVLKVDSFGCLVPGCQNVGIDTSTPLSVRKMTIYPNPANTEITIEFEEGVLPEEKEICIYNAMGAEVKKTRALKGENDVRIDISLLRDGVYFGRVFSAKGKSGVFRFVKE